MVNFRISFELVDAAKHKLQQNACDGASEQSGNDAELEPEQRDCGGNCQDSGE